MRHSPFIAGIVLLAYSLPSEEYSLECWRCAELRAACHQPRGGKSVNQTTALILEETTLPTTSRSEAPGNLPVTVIEPRPGWQLLDLGEVWRYRELLCILTWRDIKVRYK